MEFTSPPARYLTLRDYLRVLRRYRIAIVALAVLGAVAGYIAAKAPSPTYQAAASVSFQDPAQELTLVGLSPGLVQNPSTFAQQNAETLGRPQVTRAVQSMLAAEHVSTSISGHVIAGVSSSGLLVISATESNARAATLVADAFADVIVAKQNQASQAGFAQDATAVRGQIANLRAKGPVAAAQLGVYVNELARLETLSKFAQTAQVAEPAIQPGSPSPPGTVRSAAIGLALGLLLAIAVAFFRDTLDRRLRTAQDVESSFPFPVIGRVRERVLGRVAQTASIGNDKYQVDVEAFRILRRNLEFMNLESPPRSIIVTSAVAEEGKTTVAASLAFSMASAGTRTLLVDCDLRRPALSERLGISPNPGLSDFLSGNATPQQILRPIHFGDAPSAGKASANGHSEEQRKYSLVAIPAGTVTSQSTELLGSTVFKEFLEQVLGTYDAVVIDSSPLLPVADTLEILPLVEGVVICARESRTTRERALAVKAVLERFPELPTGVVITGIKPSRSGDSVYAHSYSYT